MDKLRPLIESGLVDRGDGTVFDTRTNLLWQQATSDKEFTWQEAIEYCRALRLAGYDDWRLPTIEELKTLINKRYKPVTIKGVLQGTPSIDPIFECKLKHYWSSSTLATPFLNLVWYIAFEFGDMNNCEKYFRLYVRAVLSERVI